MVGIVGTVIDPMFTLKKASSTLMSKKVRNSMTKPTIAATIVPLALSTAALSPPEKIHLTAPKRR